jgi:hypothetical protein
MDLGKILSPFLSDVEIAALIGRAEELTSLGVYPMPDPERHVIPWPPI